MVNGSAPRGRLRDLRRRLGRPPLGHGSGHDAARGVFLSALTFGSETGKWLLIAVLVLVFGLPALALLGIY